MHKITKAILLFTTTSMLTISSYGENKNNPIYIELNTGLAIKKGKENSFHEQEYSRFQKNSNHSNTALFDGAIGYRFNQNFRTDLNVTYLPEWKVNETRIVDDGTFGKFEAPLSSLSTYINAYYDFTNLQSSGITPYLTAGLGLSHMKFGKFIYYYRDATSMLYYGNTANNFSWKIGTGLNVKLNDKTYLNIGYKYADLGKIKTKSGYGAVSKKYITDANVVYKNIHSHQFIMGIGFNL